MAGLSQLSATPPGFATGYSRMVASWSVTWRHALGAAHHRIWNSQLAELVLGAPLGERGGHGAQPCLSGMVSKATRYFPRPDMRSSVVHEKRI